MSTGIFDRLIGYSLHGGVPIFILVAAIAAGLIALNFTPREEEPQIVVPMLEVSVSAPGLSAEQVARQVTIPVEKLLTQIPGVEHIYSTSHRGRAIVTLRFYVGEDREASILNTYNKLYSNQDRIPAVIDEWLVRPVEVDDVPIVMLAFWSEDPEHYDDFELRRMAEEIGTHLQAIPQTSEVNVVGGRPRTVRVLLDPESLATRQTTPLEVAEALQLSNQLNDAGQWVFGNRSLVLESGDFVRDLEELKALPVNVVDGTLILLSDVARIVDGPAEPESYGWLEFMPNHPAFSAAGETYPMVTLSVAKQRGSNAVRVARSVHDQVDRLKETLLPAEVHVEVLRDYGETANEKVNNLGMSLGFAIITVVVFIGVFLGIRPALVVGLAVPVCYGITLALDLAFGYTINRVTLFALILSLGLLVDDPITGVDNIERYMRKKGSGIAERISAAIAEIKTPLLMSTLTIILAFVPLAFITGMMGPYMAPMAFNVPVSVAASTLVAFLVTPWLASKILRAQQVEAQSQTSSLAPFYRRTLMPILNHRGKSIGVLVVVAVLFVIAASLPVFRLVPLKLLPYDNKNEIQVVIDLPEGSSLEATAAASRLVSEKIALLPEVSAIGAYIGTASPVDFNGMVRTYYRRQGPHLADLRVTLVDKADRSHQSHAVVLRLRELLEPLNTGQTRIKVVEVPPGPPVISTLVAEIHGDELTPYRAQEQAADIVIQRLRQEAQVVEIDSTVEALHPQVRFVVDKQKAALSGISTGDINDTLALANEGLRAGYLPQPRETVPLPVELRLSPDDRADLSDLRRLRVKGRAGIVQQSSPQGLDTVARPLVAIGELGDFEELPAEKPIYRKDLRPVVYVTAELSGRTPAEVIADINADQDEEPGEPGDWQGRHFLNPGAGAGWSLPEGVYVKWTGEGEWRITVRVFRDMGLAFVFALAAIFFVLRLQTHSVALSLIIMSSIPLTIIGIMPGFWLMNLFGERMVAGAPDPVMFTATAMIGMIALAGIVVRNSLILVEFITQARARGAELKEALVEAGAVRMRPVLLTAGTTMLGNLVIVLDPVFSGLALAIIFGIIASTLFTLVVVPVVYQLVFESPKVQS